MSEQQHSTEAMENIDVSSEEVVINRKQIDYYEILGIPRDASQDDITNAYNELAVKYQSPAENSKESEEVIRNINKAFLILSNVSTRQQYDLTGEDVTPSLKSDNQDTHDMMDVANLGGIGRVFGAMISRLGVPIPTQIAEEVLSTAADLCK